jgi:hypothetical protein
VNWWQLFVFVFLVWSLLGAVARSGDAVLDATDPRPYGRRGSSSCLVILVMVVTFWGAAKLVDLVIPPWGTIVVASIHVVLALVFVFFIVRYRWELRRIQRRDPN